MSDRTRPTELGLGVRRLLGLLGSAVAYFGLWIESDVTGLIGWSAVGIALLGGVTSLFWYIGAKVRDKVKSKHSQPK